MNFNLMFIGMSLLWLVLILIIARASYRAFKKKNPIESMSLILIMMILIIFSGGFAIAFGGCGLSIIAACNLLN